MHPTRSSCSIAAAAALSLLLAASPSRAHVILENPKPFLFPNYGPSNPLEPDGSDFPCKRKAGQTLEVDGGRRTVMAAGANQTLSFRGLAVHGGGSCQLSLTRDAQPTPESEWMVIHSIEGGCPARNQRGNLEAESGETYGFVVPEEIDPGEYTFSWTWSNRISGSTEIYQNCAPITVVHADGNSESSRRRRRAPPVGAADRRRAAALKKKEEEEEEGRAESSSVNGRRFPELFLANLGVLTGDCTTSEAVRQQLAIAYPDPGTSVERPEGDSNLFQQPCDGNPRARARGSPPPPPPSGHPGTSSVAPEPTSTTVAPPQTTTSMFATAITSSSAVPTDNDDSPTPTTSDVAPEPTSGTCTEGYLTCIAGTGFKTCTGGKLRPDGEAILIPPGYKCTPGSGPGLDLQPL